MSGVNETSSPEDTIRNNVEGTRSEAEKSKPCVCPKCGKLASYSSEMPCNKRSCPECGAKMLSL